MKYIIMNRSAKELQELCQYTVRIIGSLRIRWAARAVCMTKIINPNKYLAERMNGRGFLVGLAVDGKVMLTLVWLWLRVLMAVFMQFTLFWDIAPDCVVNFCWITITGSSCHSAAWMNECCRTDNTLPYDRSHLLRYVSLRMAISGGFL